MIVPDPGLGHAGSLILGLAVRVISAYVRSNRLAAHEVPELLRTIHATLVELVASAGALAATRKPAVPPKRSITPDYLICLEDGRKLKLLKRYLLEHYDMSPSQYRMKWGLPANYPMVAPSYSGERSALAKRTGLGRKTARKKRRR